MREPKGWTLGFREGIRYDFNDRTGRLIKGQNMNYLVHLEWIIVKSLVTSGVPPQVGVFIWNIQIGEINSSIQRDPSHDMKLVNLDGDGWHSGGGVVPLDFYAMIMTTTAVQLDPLDRLIDRPRFGISVGYLFSAKPQWGRKRKGGGKVRWKGFGSLFSFLFLKIICLWLWNDGKGKIL